jgi:hypothetical protein
MGLLGLRDRECCVIHSVRRASVALSWLVVGAIALAGCTRFGSTKTLASPSPIAVQPIITPSEVTSSPAAATRSLNAAESAPGSTRAVTACREGDLRITNSSGVPGGAMGGETVAIVFTNTGSQSCSMIGWPTIATPSLKTMIEYATFTGAGFIVPVTRVIVPPGGGAAASLELYAAPGNSYGECDKPGSWAITPPGGDQPTQLAWLPYQGACLGGTVIVSPVYLGKLPEDGFGSLAPSDVPELGPFSSPPFEE